MALDRIRAVECEQDLPDTGRRNAVAADAERDQQDEHERACKKRQNKAGGGATSCARHAAVGVLHAAVGPRRQWKES